ncbi:MAG: acetyl-CoA carboxylase biotin carboxylase subunit [Coriobacteriales bacterium]|jgi:acetyl-CoA carboxylase biotin carboxylase subunit|nr:acetyl-CoA carboxylase biotin carboxylase subunit [Coriobacteriales bacterium]
MLRRVLVANRGEIAARILRACREMNIETVAICSEADRGALFTTLATRSVCIGPASAAQSYLDQQAVLNAALLTGCDAIHPGFGFLSENAEFAALTRDNGLVFIGPSPEVIALLGDKDAARRLAREQGIPVVPGSQGLVGDAEAAEQVAGQLGYPVLLKAASGGGGRGIRVVAEPGELSSQLAEARAEAKACFGNDDIYIEKLITAPRHIEVQILGDSHGNQIHLGERDCTLQRNRQKVIEEAPAAAVPEELHQRMTADALRAARAVGYENAGTVEFILTPDGEYYFIEMNTRIQVEHPVTEMITGINIVREQIRIASALPLEFSQADVRFEGHAIECRINAEDPAHGFAPCPGTIEHLHLPSGFGVRVDTVAHPGYIISPYYDSLLAKIIVHGRNRHEAVLRMRRALEETLFTGITTNLGLLYMVLYSPDFLYNRIDTGTVERNLDTMLGALKEEVML